MPRIGVAVAGVITVLATTVSAAGRVTRTRRSGTITAVDVTTELGTRRPTTATPGKPTEHEPMNVVVWGHGHAHRSGQRCRPRRRQGRLLLLSPTGGREGGWGARTSRTAQCWRPRRPGAERAAQAHG